MDTLTGTTICSPQREPSAYWCWVGLLTAEQGVVQLLIRRHDIEAHCGLPPTVRIAVSGDWLRARTGDKPWLFIVNQLDVLEWPRYGMQPFS